MTMSELGDAEFEDVLAQAREEEDLSRENVVRLARDRAEIAPGITELQLDAIEQKVARERRFSTGLDDKQYPRERPKPPSRPITDRFRSEICKWHPRVKRIAELGADHHVARNRDGLAGYRNDLIRFRNTLDEVIEQLGGER